jgi:hypothetical protein
MKNPLKSMRNGLVGLLALSLLGAPQMLSAREGWKPDRHDNRGAQQYYVNNNRYGYVDRRDVYRDRNDDRYRDHRSAGESAAIIGGSAGAGAIFGAIAGGGKGAAIGALIGGIGGLIVDSATRDQHHH